MRVVALLLVGAALGGCGSSDNPAGSGPPSAVAGVAATVSNGTVNLQWDPVAGAVGYRMYMAEASGVTRSNVTTLPGNMTHVDLPEFFDHPDGLDSSTTYFFVVTAVNQAGESIESCEVSATIGTGTATDC